MHFMMQWTTSQKSHHCICHFVHGHSRKCPHNRKNHCRNSKYQFTKYRHVICFCIVLFLFFRMFFNKDADEKLQHICNCQSTAKQENPFNCLKKQCTVSVCCQMRNIFYNGFMKQCLTYITIQQRHTTNAKGSHQKCDH